MLHRIAPTSTITFYHFQYSTDATFSPLRPQISTLLQNAWWKGKVYRWKGRLQGLCGEEPEVPQRKGWSAGPYSSFFSPCRHMTFDPSHGVWRRHTTETVMAWDFAFCLLCPSRSPLCSQKHAYSSLVSKIIPSRAISHRLVAVQATGLRGVAVTIPPVSTFTSKLRFTHSCLSTIISPIR